MLSGPTPEDRVLQDIEEAALSAALEAEQESSEQRVAALEERLALIEPLLEQLQAQSALGLKLKDYVDDLRAEQKFFNKARWVVGIVCLMTVLALGWLLRDAIYHPASPLLKAPPLAIATFVVGVISGIVLLLAGFTKGVFRMTAERHAEGFLPPALDAALSAYLKFTGKAS